MNIFQHKFEHNDLVVVTHQELEGRNECVGNRFTESIAFLALMNNATTNNNTTTNKHESCDRLVIPDICIMIIRNVRV